jgi:hypothetical protein
MQWGTDHDFCMSPGDSSEQDAEGQETRLNSGNQHEMQVAPADGGGCCTSHNIVLPTWFCLCELVHSFPLCGEVLPRSSSSIKYNMYITMQPAGNTPCKMGEG